MSSWYEDKWISFAKPIRSVMDKAGGMLDDAQASTVPTLYPGMQYNGELIKSGTRINWHGQLKRAAADLWATEQNNPDNAPTLWEDIAYREGYRIIPQDISVTTQFAKGEKGWWKDVLYVSLIDANVWTPEAYPAGWETA